MDPRENRLSSAFACVAEQVPEVGRLVASRWTGLVLQGELVGRVQVPTSGGIVDVELAFRHSGITEALVWIEAKHGSQLSGGDQLARYRQALSRQVARDKVLVFLVPADFNADRLEVVLPRDAQPDDDRVRLVTWQDV